MSEYPRYYYPTDKAHHAVCMMIDHGMMFEKKDGHWTIEGLMSLRGASHYKIYVATEYEWMLDPHHGDVIHSSGHSPASGDYFVALPEDLPNTDARIVERNSLPFFMPSIELL